MGFRASCLTVLLLLVLPSTERAAEPTAAELADGLQRKYSTVRDFTADFVQEYKSVLKKRLTERGTVKVKKPGLMRWDYKSPEEKQFVSDGINMYTYIRQDRQYFITPLPTDDKATTPILFLAGKGNLVRDFTPSRVETPAGLPAGSRALKLTPKVPQTEFEWLMIVFDPSTFALRGLSFLDSQGGESTFVFTNWKENTGVATETFVFKPPRNVDKVTDATRR